MPFCTNCGAKLPDDAKFCSRCGAKVNTPPTPPPPAPPVQTKPQALDRSVPPVPMPAGFSALPLRHRCQNGHVTDGPEGQTSCPKCGAPYVPGGIIHMYRMGNMMGMAVGMGIYLNGVEYGHLGNKQSIRISVPYGQYKVHVVHTATRSCNDPVFMITPQTPYVCCKASFTNAGWAINVQQVSPDDMPKK